MNDVAVRILGFFSAVILLILATIASGMCSYSQPPRVSIDGSSTLFPINEAIAEDFSLGRRVQVRVGISGTGGGMEKFCRGEIDIAAASRKIKESERQACAARGISDIVEFDVAIDALTVLVSRQNTWAQCMTVDELSRAFRAGGATRWNQLRPEWPDEAIHFYHPGSDSGTFDYFTEAVIEATDKTLTHRADGNASEDDNIIAVGVAHDRNGLAYLGFAYYQESGNDVRAVAIDDGNGCIEPTRETATSGQYTPLSRRLFYYLRESTLRENETLVEMLQYGYANIVRITDETGYIELPPEAVQEQEAKLTQIIAGGT